MLRSRVSPVVVRESSPVGVRQEFHALGEHVGLLSRVRRGRKLPVRDVLRQRRTLEDVQLIAVDAVERKRRGGLHVVFPNVHRLARETVDQVHHDGRVVVEAEFLEARENRLAIVDAHHRTAHVRVEGLNAEREAVRARFQGRLDLFVSEAVNTSLHRDFAVVRKRQVFFHRSDHKAKILGREGGGRASAEVDRMHRVGGHGRAVAPEPDFPNERLGIARHGLGFVGILIEKAIKTACFAKRYVQIGERLSASRRVQETVERALRIGSRKRHSARSRMDDRLRRKGGVKRILRVGSASNERIGLESLCHSAGVFFKRALALIFGRLRHFFHESLRCRNRKPIDFLALFENKFHYQ